MIKEERESEHMDRICIEEWSIHDGEKMIYGKWYSPSDVPADQKIPAVIVSHGFNGSGADFDSECRYLAENGYIAYAFDFCGGSNRSKSSGKTEEMTVSSEIEDLCTVYAKVRERDLVDEKKIILFGESQGGLVTALTAEKLGSDVFGMILYYPAFCIPDNWREKFPIPKEAPRTFRFWDVLLGRKYVEDAAQMDVYSEIGRYEGRVLIFHGDEDPIVPLSYSERAMERYKNAELIIYEREGHGFSPKKSIEAAETMIGKINDWMNRMYADHID